MYVCMYVCMFVQNERVCHTISGLKCGIRRTPPLLLETQKPCGRTQKQKNNVYVFVCGVYLAVSAQMPTRGAPVQPNIESAARLR